MIYLITGGMGVGKTSLVVEMILNNHEGLFTMETDDGAVIDRPLYFCHIDGLDEQKFKAHRLTEETLQSAPLNEIVPQGSVVIVDECDYTYPVRSSSHAVPPYIRTLKELRHEGFTLILMTQHPSMLDKYVRQLVNRHIHIERKPIGSKRYEWFRCEENLTASTLDSAVVKELYKPSKEAQKYFKSASKHVKFKKKLHWIFYALPLGFILLAFLTVKIVSGWQQKADTLKAAVSSADAAVAASTPASLPYSSEIHDSSAIGIDEGMNGGRRGRGAGVEVVGAKLEDYAPRIPSLPETKPIYDGLRKPINMETVAGCVKSAKSCNCYTEQATKVYVSAEMCKHWAENGVFQVYKNMNNVAVNTPVSGQ